MAVLSATVRVDGIPRVEVSTDPQWAGGTLWRVGSDGSREQVDGPVGTVFVGVNSWVDKWVDYEAPRGTKFSYAVGRDDATGPSVQVPDSVGPWLIDRTDPSKSVPLLFDRSPLSGGSRDITLATTQVIGSDTPVTVSQTRQRPAWSLVVNVLSVSAYNALAACLSSPGPKLLRAPRSYWPVQDLDWVMIGAVGEVPGGSPAAPKWTVTLPLIPASAPAVVDRSQSGGRSWFAAKSWLSDGSWMS